MMREDNLLGIEPNSFLATTDSDHERPVYLNLARHMKLRAINQLWVADITYPAASGVRLSGRSA